MPTLSVQQTSMGITKLISKLQTKELDIELFNKKVKNAYVSKVTLQQRIEVIEQNGGGGSMFTSTVCSRNLSHSACRMISASDCTIVDIFFEPPF